MDVLIQEINDSLKRATVIDLKVIREFINGYLDGRYLNDR